MSQPSFYTSFINELSQMNTLWAGLILTLITWGLTGLGASFIFLIKTQQKKFQSILLGFTGGVMLAASIWSLIIPSLKITTITHNNKYIPVIVGILSGILFIFLMEQILKGIKSRKSIVNNTSKVTPKISLLVFAITLHNIPEGMSIGLLIGGSDHSISTTSVLSALTLAIGIGIQNIPEGLAVAIPLRSQGMSKMKSFLLGFLSAIVEPIAAIVSIVLISQLEPILPYALSFAAGAMIYVVFFEVIPSMRSSNTMIYNIFSLIVGFIIMMILDISLG